MFLLCIESKNINMVLNLLQIEEDNSRTRIVNFVGCCLLQLS